MNTIAKNNKKSYLIILIFLCFSISHLSIRLYLLLDFKILFFNLPHEKTTAPIEAAPALFLYDFGLL